MRAFVSLYLFMYVCLSAFVCVSARESLHEYVILFIPIVPFQLKPYKNKINTENSLCLKNTRNLTDREQNTPANDVDVNRVPPGRRHSVFMSQRINAIHWAQNHVSAMSNEKKLFLIS